MTAEKVYIRMRIPAEDPTLHQALLTPAGEVFTKQSFLLNKKRDRAKSGVPENNSIS